MAYTRNYKAGAVIYFEGDKAEEIFVLKSGVVTITYRGIESLAFVTERLNVGDFFGVKSVLGNFKREETAQVKADSTVLVLSMQEFEELAAKNIGLVLKMLKIFSTQLRKIGKQATAILSSSIQVSEPSNSLFNLGEYFLKTRKFDHALYAFHKYIEYYPNGPNVSTAHKHIEMAKKGESPVKTATDSTDTESTGEIDRNQMEKVTGDEAKSVYNEAKELMTSSHFSEALEKLKQIDEKSFKSTDHELFESITYERSLCLYEIGSYEDSVDAFTNFIKDNPKTAKMKTALFHIGKSYQALDDTARAINFFKKVSGLPPSEKINEEAKKLIKELSEQN